MTAPNIEKETAQDLLSSLYNDGTSPWRSHEKDEIPLRSIRLFLQPIVAMAVLIAIFYTVLFLTENFSKRLVVQFNVWQLHDEYGKLFTLNNHSIEGKVVSCYYNTPPQKDPNQLMPLDIHPHLCTHINVAFARIRNKIIYLENEQCQTLEEIGLLKKNNPKLKVLLSVGGAHNDNGFSDMVVDHASRKLFIKSIKNVLRNYSLDGIDLDWEFPNIHDVAGGRIDKRERQHFSQLLHEIRMEFVREKKNYLLTVAAAAPETIVNTAYDIDQINLYVDYVNVMTYDFHTFSKYTPFTGLNSPLFHRSTEHMFMATLNVNYTIHMFIEKGLERNKIVVGIPTYGHTYTLVNTNNAGVGSPASNYGNLGGLGFVNYPDICKFIEEFRNEVVLTVDTDAKVPYLQRGKEWVSFDTPQSILEKVRYIKKHDLRGAMIYSLNADDFVGICNQKPKGGLKFPLSTLIKNELMDEVGKLDEAK